MILWVASCVWTRLHRPAPSEIKLLTAVELAEALSVSVDTVRRMTKAHEIPVVRVRRALRYVVADVFDALMNTQAH